jgi:hypothetical protein
MSEILDENKILTTTQDSGVKNSQTPKVEDFTDENSGEISLKNLAPLQDYKPHRDREKVRSIIAIGFFLLLTLMAISSFTALVFHQISVADLKEYFSSVFAPIIAIVGTVTGFYYGSSGNEK